MEAAPKRAIWVEIVPEYRGNQFGIVPKSAAAPRAQHQYIAALLHSKRQHLSSPRVENVWNLGEAVWLILGNSSPLGCATRDKIHEIWRLAPAPLPPTPHG